MSSVHVTDATDKVSRGAQPQPSSLNDGKEEKENDYDTQASSKCSTSLAPSSSVSTSSLYRLLNACRTEKGNDFTHTSFLRPKCALYIPASFRQEFYAAYCDAFRRGEDLYVTERHRIIGPVLIDLDFRFPGSSLSSAGGGRIDDTNKALSSVSPVRQYGKERIDQIVKYICDCVSHYVSSPSEFEVHVLEKPRPVLDNNTGLIKDGVHIVIPDVVTRPVVQYIIRDMIIAHSGFRESIEALRPVNAIEDVVDKAVIEHANWMMYGSKKPAQEPYLVTRTFAYHAPSGALRPRPVLSPERHFEYVERLSIRNKYEESPLRSDTRSDIDALQAQMDDKQKKRVAIQKVLSVEPNDKHNTTENLETVKKVVGILDPRRNDNYHDWVRLGWCLRNIDYRLLETWVEFSKGSSKYMEGECESLWRTMRRGGLGLGTLYMWAKKDNPDAYRELIRNDLFDLIHRSISGTHHDVARVVHHMYRYDYACASIRHNTWYEFRNHRWVPCDSVHTLRVRISTEVFREYIGVCAYHNQAVMREDTDESEQAMHAEKSAKLNKLAMQLKVRPFKENVVKECCELFYQERFEEMLDSNPGLLGFNNGVYDLDNMEFREGRPDDYISFTTGIDYVPYDKNNECIKEIENFFRQVHPNDNIRKYVLTLLASFLSGHTHEERFHIWTGTGSNGKSKVIDLFELALGEYCCKLPVTLLTGKRAASNAASSEVARAKGKRFACLQEPSEDEKLNVGLMKELSGGDTIVTRALFKDPIQFKPMFKMLLLCNHLPNVPSDDGGTWRRIRVVEFGSKFVPNPTKENEFPIDIQIGTKFKMWAPHFMAMLLEVYRQTCNSPIAEPAEVLAFTRDYQKNNDYYADFMDTCIERVNDVSMILTLNDIFQEFKDWVHSDNIPIKVPKKKEVHSYMVKHLGKASGPTANPMWKGFRFRDRYAVSAEEDPCSGGGMAAHDDNNSDDRKGGGRVLIT